MSRAPVSPITWDPEPKPRKPRRSGPKRPVCGRCLAGDCDMCVRAGCYHPHGPEVRKVGCTVPITWSVPS